MSLDRQPFSRCIKAPWPTLTIEYLTRELIESEPELLKQIAKWFWEEWTDMYKATGVPSEEYMAVDICNTFLHGPKRFPCLMLARDGKKLFGTVGVEPKDIMPAGYKCRPPWMTCVYVAPEGRGRGVGRYVSQCAIAEAAAFGFDHLKLWTEPHNFAMYHRMGWRETEKVTIHGHPCVVMRREIAPTRKAML